MKMTSERVLDKSREQKWAQNSKTFVGGNGFASTLDVTLSGDVGFVWVFLCKEIYPNS